MKKIYMQPTMKVVVLKRCLHLLAGSLGAGDLPQASFDNPLPGSGLNADSPFLGLGDLDF